jgi:hypothetical protein
MYVIDNFLKKHEAQLACPRSPCVHTGRGERTKSRLCPADNPLPGGKNISHAPLLWDQEPGQSGLLGGPVGSRWDGGGVMRVTLPTRHPERRQKVSGEGEGRQNSGYMVQQATVRCPGPEQTLPYRLIMNKANQPG